jgi:hypothetical protein
LTNLKQELPVAAMFVNLKVPGTLIVLCGQFLKIFFSETAMPK